MSNASTPTTPMSNASTPTTPGFLSSTGSSSYELDLPPLPRGKPSPLPQPQSPQDHQQQQQQPPSSLHLASRNTTKTHSSKTPVYGNIMRKSAGSAPQLSSQAGANVPLGTILEAGDSDSTSSEESEADFVDKAPIYTNSLDLLVQEEEEKEERQYTPLSNSTRNSDTYNLYTVPDLSIQASSKKPRPPRRTSDPDKEDHVTNYIMVSDNGSSVTSATRHAPPPPLRYQSKRTSHWKIRDTLNRKYNMMKKVGMMSFCQSHSGAKKFFTVVTAAAILLLLAVCAIAIAAVSWNDLSSGMDEIEGTLNNHITVFKACRVGRNWTSVTVNSSSAPGKCQCTLRLENACDCDIGLSDFTQNTTGASQVLLYVIVRVVPLKEPDGITLATSFVNIALWTTYKDVGRSFREYLAVLNDPSSTQVVSRNIWFPTGDRRLFVKADLLGEESSDQEVLGGSGSLAQGEELTVYITTYLAGYC